MFYMHWTHERSGQGVLPFKCSQSSSWTQIILQSLFIIKYCRCLSLSNEKLVTSFSTLFFKVYIRIICLFFHYRFSYISPLNSTATRASAWSDLKDGSSNLALYIHILVWDFWTKFLWVHLISNILIKSHN